MRILINATVENVRLLVLISPRLASIGKSSGELECKEPMTHLESGLAFGAANPFMHYSRAGVVSIGIVQCFLKAF
jgi:hypothetical protein